MTRGTAADLHSVTRLSFELVQGAILGLRGAHILIYADDPTDWKDLEDRVCRIFAESGCSAVRGAKLRTVRGDVEVDVVVEDATSRPRSLIICECKQWGKAVPKTVIHAFRTVVQDVGANLGIIVSNAGFQAGAYEAAVNSNIRLFTWAEFQEELYERWVGAQADRLGKLADEVQRLANRNVFEGPRSLIDQALEHASGQDWLEHEELKEAFPDFEYLSPACGHDPSEDIPTVMAGRLWNDHLKDFVASPREYFDRLSDAAARSFATYAAFILRQTGGVFGNAVVFDDETLGRLLTGETTREAAEDIIGRRRDYSSVGFDGGETWHISGSITRFEPEPGQSGDCPRVFFAETTARSLTITFDDEVLREVKNTEYRYFGHP